MEDNINMNGEFTILPDDISSQSVPPAPAQKPSAEEQPVGFWTYIGLFLLFAIPIVGFIAAIVFIFAPKRKSLKNFAGAVVTYMVTSLVITILIISLIITAIGNAFVPAINNALGTEFQTFSEVTDVVSAFMNGDYSLIIKILKPQLLEAIGREYEALLDELANQDYNKLIGQLINEEYAPLLEDLKGGEYASLEAVLGKEDFDSFVNEVEIAANGEMSELLGGISQLIPPELSGFLK